MSALQPVSRDEIRAAIREAVKSQIYSQAAVITADEVRKELMKVTADQRRQVIQGLLGVDNKWGEVRLYETNGHVTELQKWIRDALGDELRDFVVQSAREAWDKEKSKLKAEIKTAVCKHIASRTGAYEFRRLVDDFVKGEFSSAVGEIFTEVVKEIMPLVEPEHTQ